MWDIFWKKKINLNVIRYVYTASGKKIRKEDFTTTKLDYRMNAVYSNGTLEFIANPEGRMMPAGSSWRYEYQANDHLGNLHSTYYKNLAAPVGTDPITLLQENHYDPWGINLTDIEKPYTLSNRFQFNSGVEKGVQPSGSYTYETDYRAYDPQLGRFMALDPLLETTPSINPYSFGGNNPVSMVDPDGRFSFLFTFAKDLVTTALVRGGVRFY